MQSMNFREMYHNGTCQCTICTSPEIMQVTDGDYDHNFVVANAFGVPPYIKPGMYNTNYQEQAQCSMPTSTGGSSSRRPVRRLPYEIRKFYF